MVAMVYGCSWSKITAQVAPPNDSFKNVSHTRKWFIHLTNNLFLLIAHPPSRCSIAVTGCMHSCHSHLFVDDEFQWPQTCFAIASSTLAYGGIFNKRIQWLKGGSRLIKVTCWCEEQKAPQFQPSNEDRRSFYTQNWINRYMKTSMAGGVERTLSPEGGSWPFKSQQVLRRLSCFHVCWRHSFTL